MSVSGTSSSHLSKRSRVSDAVDDNIEVEKKENPASNYEKDPVVMAVYQDPDTKRTISSSPSFWLL